MKTFNDIKDREYICSGKVLKIVEDKGIYPCADCAINIMKRSSCENAANLYDLPICTAYDKGFHFEEV